MKMEGDAVLNFYEQQEIDAVARVTDLLALPSIPSDGLYSDGQCFCPWDLFPSLYGSYSKAFDDLALAVLADIRDGTHWRDDLAGEMFREMLCTTGLCDYGTSPRTCFASPGFARLLPSLVDRWADYARSHWSDN
jgi:hypothetical protein